jgi:hypothetical protein
MDYPMTPDANNRIGALEKENYELSETVAQLQEALMFWLPNVPDAPEDVSDRAAKDAWLLAGYQGQDVPSAEKRGWIALAGRCATTSLTDEEILNAFATHQDGYVFGTPRYELVDTQIITCVRALLSAEKQQIDTSHVAGGKPEADTSLEVGLLAAEAKPLNEAIRATDADWKGFAMSILDEHRQDGYPSDVDGGTIQDAAVKYGLLVEREVTEPCGETCTCAEVTDFPTTCFFKSDAAIAATKEQQ